MEVTRLQLALHPNAGVGLLDLHDDGRVRPSQLFGQHHARLRKSVVIRLQASKDQVEILILHRGSKRLRGIEGVKTDKGIAFQVDGAVRALSEPLAQHLLRARGTAGDNHDLASVLLLLAQGLFQRVGIRLVDFVGNVLANPCSALVQLQRSVLLRDLLHAHQDFHPALLRFGPRSLGHQVLGRQRNALRRNQSKRIREVAFQQHNDSPVSLETGEYK